MLAARASPAGPNDSAETLQYRVGKTLCKGHQDPSKRVPIFLGTPEANVKMVPINSVALPRNRTVLARRPVPGKLMRQEEEEKEEEEEGLFKANAVNEEDPEEKEDEEGYSKQNERGSKIVWIVFHVVACPLTHDCVPGG